jgi:hypothetical protein
LPYAGLRMYAALHRVVNGNVAGSAFEFRGEIYRVDFRRILFRVSTGMEIGAK